MGQKSVKEDKNIYHKLREDRGLSRAAASELLQGVTESRLIRIEIDGLLPYPEEIKAMSEAYKEPGLCNYYCSQDCPLGQYYVPKVKIKDLSVITLEMLALLNQLNKEKERLIEITVDGIIDEDEIKDFKKIRSDLEKMSMTIDSMQLWIDNSIAAGEIDKKAFE